MCFVLVSAAPSFAAEPADAEYLRVVTERAEKIVAPLALPHADQAVRVRDLIAQQYVGLAKIHDGSDRLIEDLREFCGEDEQAFEPAAQAIRNAAEIKINQLHREFLGKLSAELTPEQVDAVKDGLTYGVVPVTYKAYADMLPDLTDEQKRAIKAWLVEAREHAMDAGSSEQKHWWFGKYKGRINNFLSAAGYDLKQAEKEWRQRLKEQSQVSN
jgi:hypothetical protein